MLLDTMSLLQKTGTNWASIFDSSNFPTGPVPTDSANDNNHGVNLGQALKEATVAWRFLGNQSNKDSTQQRWDVLYRYHSLPSGS
jgi:hypothetical protein